MRYVRLVRSASSSFDPAISSTPSPNTWLFCRLPTTNVPAKQPMHLSTFCFKKILKRQKDQMEPWRTPAVTRNRTNLLLLDIRALVLLLYRYSNTFVNFAPIFCFLHCHTERTNPTYIVLFLNIDKDTWWWTEEVHDAVETKKDDIKAR